MTDDANTKPTKDERPVNWIALNNTIDKFKHAIDVGALTPSDPDWRQRALDALALIFAHLCIPVGGSALGVTIDSIPQPDMAFARGLQGLAQVAVESGVNLEFMLGALLGSAAAGHQILGSGDHGDFMRMVQASWDATPIPPDRSVRR